MSDFFSRFYDDLRKQYESMTSPGYFSSTGGEQFVIDRPMPEAPFKEGEALAGITTDFDEETYPSAITYRDPLAGLSVEERKYYVGDREPDDLGGITTARGEEYNKTFTSTAEKPARYKKDLKTIQSILEETAGGELPEPIKVEGRMPGLLGISQSSPRYRPTPEPYTYGQFESQLMTPSQQMAQTQKYLEQLFKSTIAAAPRLNFRGLL
jgi:hypothetical protein